MVEAADKIVRVRIEGRVQGVGFRAWTVREARTRRLHGWVRNRASGGVEAVFSGTGEAVDAMISACRRGPRGAYVASVDVAPADSGDLGSLETGRFVQLGTI